jgi:hypothetical protein
MVWTGLMWLRIGTHTWLLWTIEQLVTSQEEFNSVVFLYLPPPSLHTHNTHTHTHTCRREWSSGQSSWLLNGDLLCFLWGTNWIYICYVEESRPPLWSSGQSSWLQNGDLLCFLWGTNWFYICYVEERLPLWSSGQGSWLQNGDVLCFLWGTKKKVDRPYCLVVRVLAAERRCIVFPVKYELNLCILCKRK